MRRALPFLVVVCTLSAPAAAETDAVVENLRRQLRERDAEIGTLRQQVRELQSKPDNASPSPIDAAASPPDIAPPPASPEKPVDPSCVPASQRTEGSTKESDYEAADPLDIALVRQGGRVLSPGTIEVEPEVSYFYDEPITGMRRDNVSVAITTRVGLRWAMQAELRVPYVIQDHWSSLGTSSGLGDIVVGLTKELVVEREHIPALLAFVQWRTTTGDVNRNPPTGFGQDAIQIGLTTAKRQDPVVLFGSLSYTANLGTAHLSSGARTESGNVFGGRLGLYLAATPDTTLLYDVAVNSSSADRFNGQQVDATDRLRGMLELGTTTVIGRDKYLSVTAGVGFTPAAPRFVLTVSVPWRF